MVKTTKIRDFLASKGFYARRSFKDCFAELGLYPLGSTKLVGTLPAWKADDGESIEDYIARITPLLPL